MKKYFIPIINLTIVTIVLIAFFTRQSLSEQKVNPSIVVKIGYIGVLSGPAAVAWGEDARKAAEMAAEELNDSQKEIDVQITFTDSALKPDQGISELRRLQELSSPDVFIADGSAVANAIAPLANELKKPIVLGAVALPEVTRQSDFLFRNFYSCDQSAPDLAEQAYKTLNHKTMAVLSQHEPYGQSCKDQFSKSFKAVGGLVVADETYLVSDSDFRTQLQKIRSHNPDAVYIVGYEKQLEGIVRQMKELGIQKTILSEMVLYAPVIRDHVRELINPPSVYMPVIDFYLNRPEAQRFQEQFNKKFGKQPAYLSGYIYDTVHLIVDAASISKSEGLSLQHALKKVNRDGVIGTLQFNTNRETQTQFTIVQWNQEGLKPIQ